MTIIKTVFATFAAAGVFLLPVVASAEPVSVKPETAEAKLDVIKLALFSHRRTPNLFWRIDSTGKGEITVPASLGYKVEAPLIIDPVFQIAPGVHSFDIGASGYAELRAYLAQIMDSKFDPFKMSDSNCVQKSVSRSGTVDMTWSGKAEGALSLPNDCLNGAGQYFHDHMVRAWHVLARHVHSKNVQTRGGPAVTILEQPVVPIPKTLSSTKTSPWTGASTSWSVDSNGKGWIEFSQDLMLPTLDMFQSSHAKAGRRHFQLDSRFHQGVLRELNPYVSGAKRNGACEDEISTTDQPMVRLEWTDKANKSEGFASDLGCPSFAARFNKVEQAFALLVAKGSLGDSRLLTGK